MIAVQNLEKKLGGKPILKSISFSLSPGIYGLLGANGAGKTTLIRCLTGLYKQNGGSISYNGVAVDKANEYQREMGYLPQAFGMFRELTVKEMMEYFCALKDVPKKDWQEIILRALSAVNMETALKSRVSALSGGMTRRVGIAQTLLGDTKVLYFDEPTSGLDPEERVRFKSLIAQMRKDKTVLISTHIVEDVASGCDNVLVIDKGCLLFNGSCDELRSQAVGKIGEFRDDEFTKLPEEYFIIKSVDTAEGIRHRILCRNIPEDKIVPPTLEDGYISLIKGC